MSLLKLKEAVPTTCHFKKTLITFDYKTSVSIGKVYLGGLKRDSAVG
jgi:hypothetical protein